MPRRSLAALAALLILTPVAASAEPAPAPAPAALVIEGKGFGHGVGMAQDGALALASNGASAAAILSRFYPGTALARRSASVRVGVYDAPGAATFVFPSGGEVRDAPSGAQSPGFPVTGSPGGTVSVVFDGGKYKATPVSGAALTRTPAPAPAPVAPVPAPPGASAAPAPPVTPPTTSILDPLLQALLPTTVPPTTAPPATVPGAAGAPLPASQTFAPTARGLWAVPKGDSLVALPGTGRSYRGTLIVAAGGRGLQLTDELDVEQYLRGMGEMPASWPAAALQAQAIAARTYAIRAATAGRTLCDDQQCQVYIGAGNESGPNSAAVAATRGQVLTYQGALAEAVYSASAGGTSASAEEGFGPGSPDIPYLKPVDYPVADPQLWATSLPLTEVAARFGYPGELREVRVTRTGPSGRPLEITFEGSGSPMVVDAHRFFSVLQLRSTFFTLRTEAPAGVAVAEPPLNARAPDAPSLVGARPDPLVAAPIAAPASSLGRAPWVGLAVLLLSAWGSAAHRATDRRPAPALAGAPAGGPGPDGEDDDDRTADGDVASEDRQTVDDGPAEPAASPDTSA